MHIDYMQNTKAAQRLAESIEIVRRPGFVEPCHVWKGSKPGDTQSPRATVQGKDGRPERKTIRQLAYESGNGPIPAGHIVVTLCGDSRCSQPSHLTAIPRNEAYCYFGESADSDSIRIREYWIEREHRLPESYEEVRQAASALGIQLAGTDFTVRKPQGRGKKWEPVRIGRVLNLGNGQTLTIGPEEEARMNRALTFIGRADKAPRTRDLTALEATLALYTAEAAGFSPKRLTEAWRWLIYSESVEQAKAAEREWEQAEAAAKRKAEQAAKREAREAPRKPDAVKQAATVSAKRLTKAIQAGAVSDPDMAKLVRNYLRKQPLPGSGIQASTLLADFVAYWKEAEPDRKSYWVSSKALAPMLEAAGLHRKRVAAGMVWLPAEQESTASLARG